jgi:GT2 family glycosyltransferase/Flp pilus assembly protein TadD
MTAGNRGVPKEPEIIIEETDGMAPLSLYDSPQKTRAAFRTTEANRARPLVSILVFAYNNLEKHTKTCVEAILRYTRDIDYELVLLDNGSDDGTFDYFRSVSFARKKIVRVTRNKGANYGQFTATRYLTGRYVVMIANDVYVTENWLSNMIACAESDERIGFLATFSDNVSNLQEMRLPFASLEEMWAQAARYNVSDPRKWEERLRLMPAIAFYRRECLDIIGSLDYAFRHDFSDDDISFRVRRAGYRIVCCGDTFVHHSGSSAAGSSEAKMEVLRRGREIFRQKYHGIDAWEDINNFELLMLHLVEPEEKRGSAQPQVLGIDVRCGTPILQLKNKLRLAGIFAAKLSAFVQEPKYWLDLSTICDGSVAVDRIDHLTDHFPRGSFDYILLGKPLSSYSGTEKLLCDLFSLLTIDGQLLVKLENRFDRTAFLASGGQDLGESSIVTGSVIDEINSLSLKQGCFVKEVRRTQENLDDAGREAICALLKGTGRYPDSEAAFAELMAAEYALKIVRTSGSPDGSQAPPSRVAGCPPGHGDDLTGDHPSFGGFEEEEAVAGMTSIVMVTCNGLAHTRRCIEALRCHTPEPHEIIFVDNGSTDGTLQWLQNQVRENETCRLVENGENGGSARGRNQGIALARGEYLLLLDNDTVVTPGWLSAMLRCLNRRADTGIVGPMSPFAPGPQRITDESYHSADGLAGYAEAFAAGHRHRRIACRNIAGFAMLLRRDLIGRIGPFDERFGTGRCEDEDFCLRAALAGFENIIAGDVFIHHDGRPRLPVDRRMIEKKWTLSTASEAGKRFAVLRATEVAGELYRKGKTGEAAEELINCIKINPEAPEIYLTLARMFIESRQFSEAWDVVASMPEALRNSPEGLACAGYAREGLGLDGEAAADALAMLSQNEKDPAALNLQGVLAYKKGDREGAGAWFVKAVEADPGYGEACTNLGVLAWVEEKREKSLQCLRRGFVLAPTVPDHGSLYYSAACSLDRYADAEGALGEARSLYPSHRNIAWLYIDSLMRQEKFGGALNAIEDAMAVFGIDDDLLGVALSARERIGPHRGEKGHSATATLSLCMIVKDEEDHIVKCLRSVRNLVDEMIVVDTGSADRTRDLAKACGARVYDFSWTNDFAEARNYSLSQATGDWIVVLDADETLSPADHDVLRELIGRKYARPVAYDIVTRNYTTRLNVEGWTANDGRYAAEEAGNGWYPSAKVRLFPNHPQARFVNPVHECVEPSLLAAGMEIKPCPVWVHHYGRMGGAEKIQQKREAYYLMGRKKLEEQGNEPKAIYELALAAGELEKHEEAVELWNRFITADPRVPSAFVNLGALYMKLGRLDEALQASQKALALDPDLKEAAVNYGSCRILTGDVQGLAGLLDKVLRRVPDYIPALCLLGTVHGLEGRLQQASACLDLIREKGFDTASYLCEHSQKLHAQGRSGDASALLAAAVRTGHDNQETHRLLAAHGKGQGPEGER